MEKIVIVGGGVAGLSCLNALIDNQVTPLLIEGSTIGSPKMCGEFLAPPVLKILEQWEVGPIEFISQASFQSTYSNLTIPFSPAAGAIMRSVAENQLAKRARALDGRIYENTRLNKVIPASKSSPYYLHLESGDIIEAQSVIFATGRWAKNSTQNIQLPYYGIKLHIEHILSPQTLYMFSAPGAYFGLVPVSSTKSNLTCIVKHSKINPSQSKEFLNQLINCFPLINTFFEDKNLHDLNWLTAPSPQFRIKETPHYTNAYWIGDAVVSLPPAIGLGFAQSINSGITAAQYYLQSNPVTFASMIRRDVRKKFYIGKLMHHILLNPLLTCAAFPLLKSTWFLNKCMRSLSYK